MDNLPFLIFDDSKIKNEYDINCPEDCFSVFYLLFSPKQHVAAQVFLFLRSLSLYSYLPIQE